MAQTVQKRYTNVIDRVRDFTERASKEFVLGSPEYFLNLALKEAVAAVRGGNYGVGAVVLLKKGEIVHVFKAQNGMITGPGIMDHAETRGLVEAASFNDHWFNHQQSQGDVPKSNFHLSSHDHPYLDSLTEGLHVIGTLEPCPMCMSYAIEANIGTSISGCLDGGTEKQHVEMPTGTGMGAMSKWGILPLVMARILKSQGVNWSSIELRNQNVPDRPFIILKEYGRSSLKKKTELSTPRDRFLGPIARLLEDAKTSSNSEEVPNEIASLLEEDKPDGLYLFMQEEPSIKELFMAMNAGIKGGFFFCADDATIPKEVPISTGAAVAIGPKRFAMPESLQGGIFPGYDRFQLLDSQNPLIKELLDMCELVFTATREAIDAKLAGSIPKFG